MYKASFVSFEKQDFLMWNSDQDAAIVLGVTIVTSVTKKVI